MNEFTIVLNLVLFPIGLLLTWFITYRYYQRSKNQTNLQPFVDYSTGILSGIESRIKERLKVQYDDSDVKNLFELKFVIANTGNVVINNITKPLTLKFSDEYEVLNVEIVRIEPKGRKINLHLSENSEKIGFEFNLLNPGEFFELKVLLKNNDTESKIELPPPSINDYKFSIEAGYLNPELATDYLYNVDQNRKIKGRKESKILFVSGILNLLIYGSLAINYNSLSSELFNKFDFSTIIFTLAIILLVVSFIGLIFILLAIFLSKRKKTNSFKYDRNTST